MIRKILFRNFLFIHRISQWVRQHFTHTGILLLAVIITATAFGLNTRMTHSYQITAFLLALFFISFISIIFHKSRLYIKRSLPQYATAGLPLEYKINIHNPSSKTLYNLTVFDNLGCEVPKYNDFRYASDQFDSKRNVFDRFVGYPRLVSLIRKKRGADIQQVNIDKIENNEYCEKIIMLTPVRRGYIHFKETVIAKTDPVGLIRKINRYKHTDSLLILPKYYKFPDIKLPGKRKYQHGGMTLASSVGDSEEFFSLREYRPGDPLKSIHWRSYAKKGEPVIKEYQDEYFSRLGLVLDTFSDNRPDYLFEDAVSIAASIAISKHHQDELLDLIFINDKAYRFTSGRGLAGTENMLEILACVETAKQNEFNILSNLVLKYADDSSGLVFIFLEWDTKRQTLIRQLRKKNLPLLVIVLSESGEVARTDDDPMADIPQFFLPFKAGEIQQSINKISSIQ